MAPQGSVCASPIAVAKVPLLTVEPPDSELVDACVWDWRVTVVEKFGRHEACESAIPVS